MPGYSADGLRDEGVGEVELSGLGIAETGSELVAQRHQFIDFGDDAVLLWQGRQRENGFRNLPYVQVWLRATFSKRPNIFVCLLKKNLDVRTMCRSRLD